MSSPTDKAEKVSLSKSQPTNARGVPDKASTIKTQEQFFSVLEGEMRKIDGFTRKMVLHIRSTLTNIEQELGKNSSEEKKANLQSQVWYFRCKTEITNLIIENVYRLMQPLNSFCIWKNM